MWQERLPQWIPGGAGGGGGRGEREMERTNDPRRKERCIITDGQKKMSLFLLNEEVFKMSTMYINPFAGYISVCMRVRVCACVRVCISVCLSKCMPGASFGPLYQHCFCLTKPS